MRARLFERRHAAGVKAPRDAFGHVRDAETLDIDAVWIPKLFDLVAETAQLLMHGSNDYVHVLSSEGAGTDATAEESEITSVRKDTTSNASRCGATSPMARCQHEARHELMTSASPVVRVGHTKS